MRYALLMHHTEPEPGEVPEAEIQQMQELFAHYTEALHTAGVLIDAHVLHPTAASTTVTRSTGQVQIQDGPFAETKEALAGIFMVEVPDADAALAWAQKCPGTRYGTIEVRPVATFTRAGAWTAPSPAVG